MRAPYPLPRAPLQLDHVDKILTNSQARILRANAPLTLPPSAHARTARTFSRRLPLVRIPTSPHSAPITLHNEHALCAPLRAPNGLLHTQVPLRLFDEHSTAHHFAASPPMCALPL